MIKPTNTLSGTVEEVFSLEMLNTTSTSVVNQMFFVVNDDMHPIGTPHYAAYANDDRGRLELEASNLPANFKRAVFSVWGTDYVITEIEEETEDTAHQPPK